MKVLIIINNLGVGGAERLVVDSINEMLRRGIEVRLVTFAPEKEGASLRSQCQILPNDWTVLEFRNFFKIGSWLKLIALIRAYKPDVVYTHLWYANTIGRIAARISRVPRNIQFEHNVYDALKSRK